jgi:hypothetical protein
MKYTLYEILRVKPDASTEDICAAAKRLAQKYHPKNNPDNPKALAYFKHIQRAYRVLTNPTTRTAYDEKLQALNAALDATVIELAREATIQKQAPPEETSTVSEQSAEPTVYRARLHWSVLIPSILILLVSMQLLFVNPELFSFLMQQYKWLAENPSEVVVGIVLIVSYGVYSLCYELFSLLTTQLILTNKRVIFKTGLIFRKQQAFNYDSFEKVAIKQGFFGKIFGFGKIYLQAFGGIKMQLHHIAAPHQFEDTLIRSVRTSIYKVSG